MEYVDQHLFEEIYEAYFSSVYNYISYRINNHMDTEDLVSQVFSKVIEKYTSYNPERATLSTWIMSIARNTVTDYFRIRQRNVPLEIDSLEQYLTTDEVPDDIFIKKEQNIALISALNTLTARERNMIALKYGARLGNKEIAQVMEVSETNVGVIMSRSIKKLRLYFKKEELKCGKIALIPGRMC